MDGIHDLGGMEGFGSVEREENEPVFHEPWHGTAFAIAGLSMAVLHNHNPHEYRHAVERMTPQHYLGVHYYERMFTGATTLLVEKGVLDLGDLEDRAGGRLPLAQPLADNPLEDLAPQPEARFALGDRVRVKEIHPNGHTRAPRFCRGRTGVVLHVAPRFDFPDASAHGGERRKEHTYHVEFTGDELWGNRTDADSVVVDLWDSYLEEVGR